MPEIEEEAGSPSTLGFYSTEKGTEGAARKAGGGGGKRAHSAHAANHTFQNSDNSMEENWVTNGRNMDPKCVNARNPYHKCTEYCSGRSTHLKSQIRGYNSVHAMNHMVQNCDNGMEERRVTNGRNINPKCVNARNPYHKCTEYCSGRSAELKSQIKGPNSVHAVNHMVQNGENGMEESRVTHGRNMDPKCINARNPYHKCGEYCSGRSTQLKNQIKGAGSIQIKGANSAQSVEELKMGDTRKVDPRCTNSSNPYHICTEKCFQRSHNTNYIEEGRSGKSMATAGAKSKCNNASNPYHKCSEDCLKRFQEAMQSTKKSNLD